MSNPTLKTPGPPFPILGYNMGAVDGELLSVIISLSTQVKSFFCSDQLNFLALCMAHKKHARTEEVSGICNGLLRCIVIETS